MEIILSTYIIGLLTSVFTEIVKFIPKIGQNEFIKSLTAVILVALGAFLTIGFTWSNFFWVMLFAFGNYKMIVQPVAKALGLPSQPIE